jgi:hypothetical protein
MALTRRTSNLMIAVRMGAISVKGEPFVSLRKKRYTNCSVLVYSRTTLESSPILFNQGILLVSLTCHRCIYKYLQCVRAYEFIFYDYHNDVSSFC